MRVLTGLLVLLVSSVSADLSSKSENSLDKNLRHLDLSHLLNTTGFGLSHRDHPHAHLNVVSIIHHDTVGNVVFHSHTEILGLK